MQSLLAFPDIARNIVSLLDNATMLSLYSLDLIPSLSSLASDPVFWYDRMCALARSELLDLLPYSQDVDWKQTYQLLLLQLEGDDYPDFYNEEDNATILGYLGSVYPPCSDELRRAVVGNKPNILSYLLDRLSSDEVLQLEDPDQGELPLTTAAKNGYSECVRFLLARPELDPHIEDLDGNIPLEVACLFATRDGQEEYAAIVRMLLSSERPLPASVTLTRLPIIDDCAEVIRTLISHPMLYSIDAYNEALESVVIGTARPETLKMLLETWKNIPILSSSVLDHTLRTGKLELAELLLQDNRIRAKVTTHTISYMTQYKSEASERMRQKLSLIACLSSLS